MTESGNKSELGTKFKFSSFFNRSLMIHWTSKSQPSPLERAASINKFYNSYESVKRGFRVWVDQHDISMDSAYRLKLQNVLGEKNANLPQVFIRGKHVDGADVIKQMFETG